MGGVDIQKVPDYAVVFFQLLAIADMVNTCRINVHAEHQATGILDSLFGQHLSSCLKKGATSKAGIEYCTRTVGKCPLDQNPRNILGRVIRTQNTPMPHLLSVTDLIIPAEFGCRRPFRGV